MLKDFASTLQEALQSGINAYRSSLPIAPSQIVTDLVNSKNLEALRRCMASFADVKNDTSRNEPGETLNCAYTTGSHNLSIEFPIAKSKSQVSVQLVRSFNE